MITQNVSLTHLPPHRMLRSMSLVLLVMSSIYLNNSVIYIVQEKEIFKQYQTDHNLVKDAREKRQNTIYKVDLTILCSSFHLMLRSQKHFPLK